MVRGAATALLLTAAVFTLALAAPSGALAGSNQQSILQDDYQLVFDTTARQLQVLEQLKSLGVGVVKVSLIWRLVAPDPERAHKPSFDASNPAAYQRGAWRRYDTLDENAHALGLGVYFQFVPLDPAWAAARDVQRGQGRIRSQAPNLRYFQEWVKAVGRRYSGSWRGINHEVIPRVDEWGIWNEPNSPGSLHPWHETIHGREVLTEPLLYRGIVKVAWRALSATGHRRDTILLGETAHSGKLTPLAFFEDVYCVGNGYHPLTGRGAEAVGCPTSPDRSRFVAQNPGLFDATGWAHHPYGFDLPPNRPSVIKDGIGLLDVGLLERTANGIFSTYDRSRRGGIPIYLSEWGYVTNPPNPTYQATLSDQATWINQGEYMAWRDPYVKALAQFELVDTPTPRHQSYERWRVSFTTGLEFNNGRPKPALASYRLPIWLPAPRRGSQVPVWGQLRPANHFTTQVGEIQFQRSGSSTWENLHPVTTTNHQGFFYVHVDIPSAGSVRLAWTSPSLTTYYSRAAAIS
jgi:hypothetical protein